MSEGEKETNIAFCSSVTSGHHGGSLRLIQGGLDKVRSYPESWLEQGGTWRKEEQRVNGPTQEQRHLLKDQ